MKTRRTLQVLALLVFAAFIWAVIHLFEIRFARGDIYPPYSSLRTDPLGAKVFYASLARLGQPRVSRNENRLEQFLAGEGTTLLYIGARNIIWSEKTTLNLEKFIKAGGRLVIAFFPKGQETSLVEKEKPTPSPTPSPGEEMFAERLFFLRDLTTRWQFKVGNAEKLVNAAAKRHTELKVDPEISWHSALHFQDSAPEWTIAYAVAGLPVVIERRLGEGTIVLASDSYFLSNEAMRRERHSATLAWLVGPSRHVIFDESHLGLREDPGVTTLIRRYHLGGLILGFVVLAALAVWKNGARLVPASATRRGDEIIAGKDSFEGFVNLLRRNVAPQHLLLVCLAEWEKFLPRHIRQPREKIAHAQNIIANSSNEAAQRRDAVGIYREVTKAINKKWKP